MNWQDTTNYDYAKTIIILQQEKDVYDNIIIGRKYFTGAFGRLYTKPKELIKDVDDYIGNVISLTGLKDYIQENIYDYECEAEEDDLNSDEIAELDKYKRVNIYLDTYLIQNPDKSENIVEDMFEFINLANDINNVADEANNKEFAELVNSQTIEEEKYIIDWYLEDCMNGHTYNSSIDDAINNLATEIKNWNNKGLQKDIFEIVSFMKNTNKNLWEDIDKDEIKELVSKIENNEFPSNSIDTNTTNTKKLQKNR